MPEPEPPGLAPLYAKIAAAQAKMSDLTRDKTVNVETERAQYSYAYITEGSVMKAARQVLSPLGVAIFVDYNPPVDLEGGGVRVTCNLTFADGESGQTITVRNSADSFDKTDKAANKAGTSALRIALTKNLLQGGEDDGEHESHERTGASRSARIGNAAELAGSKRVAVIFGKAKAIGLTRAQTQRIIAYAVNDYDYLTGAKKADDHLTNAQVDRVLDFVTSFPGNEEVAEDMMAKWQAEIEALQDAEAVQPPSEVAPSEREQDLAMFPGGDDE